MRLSKVHKGSENLKSFTKENAKEIGRRGGLKSAEVKKQRKTMADTLKIALTMNAPKKVQQALKEAGIKEIDNQTAIAIGQIQAAMTGDTRAAVFVRDTIGEIPGHEIIDENAEVKQTFIPAKMIGKAFSDVNRMMDDREYLHWWFEGGRGSLKSSFVSLKVIELIMNNPTYCALALRKVKDTLRDSVYNQLVWAIDMLGLGNEFKCTVSPMAIVRISTGQQIYFRGADEPSKIKSIRPKTGMYLAICWYEELDQFHGMREIRMINQSIMRGGEDFVMIYSYNTPRTRQHWVNSEKLDARDDRLVLRTTYKDAPRSWLGSPFFEEAEHLKQINLDDYLHEYEGEAVGSGGAIFPNLELREITDEEIATFGYCYQGLDFGWFPDPLAWVRVSYNPNHEQIFIFDEICKCKLPNETVAEMIKERKALNEDIAADSAEPKSINDLKDSGLNIRGVVKGPGSVEYGMKWLARRNIIIDPARCPNAAREFQNYEFEQNKDGEYVSGYPDKDNHLVDATRYSLVRVMRLRENKA